MIIDLTRLINEAQVLAGGEHSCRILGHKWISRGGCNAGCSPTCSCSVPVNHCEVCGDCDYGDNEEADQVIADCLNNSNN